MTDPKYTHVAIILDRSGSMSPLIKSTLDGFNEFIQAQRALPGKIRVDVVQFDHEYQRWLNDAPISEVPALTQENYQPRGTTALFDAIGRTIDALGATLSAKPESERPGKVIVVIQTDGAENASKDYTRQRVFDLIQQQEKQYAWDFLFIGAGKDAFTQASSIGISAASTLGYATNSIGTRALYRSIGQTIASAHVGGTKAVFKKADQDAQDDAAGK